MKENKNVKEKVMKILLIDGRLPRTSYVLRTFVGFYLIYIDYNIWSGLGEPDVSNVPLVMAAGAFFAVAAALCIASGAYGLMNKEYREEKMDDEQVEAEILAEGQPEEQSIEEKNDILQAEIVPEEKNK